MFRKNSDLRSCNYCCLCVLGVCECVCARACVRNTVQSDALFEEVCFEVPGTHVLENYADNASAHMHTTGLDLITATLLNTAYITLQEFLRLHFHMTTYTILVITSL